MRARFASQPALVLRTRPISQELFAVSVARRVDERTKNAAIEYEHITYARAHTRTQVRRIMPELALAVRQQLSPDKRERAGRVNAIKTKER